ncbi:Inner membrane protein [Borrelia miyamotoi]|uniref:DedA family protein n=1 Tax=Borrelia miyamotoi TaxID=47466 RepID=A0AAP8YS19_9SPIR|nr:DedA family protein [Borrelia miyamotoi]AHH05166.1 Alkaline phosphatase like protein [Borrelia miyamotoi FR64b]ATQ14951.1 DedA family protein [Borrelia miyamotoi]ATQ16134.1 DedA family protein [Borrelia miyamotoi]ATQ17279.1 DedA family protein [Borrelia miyamotoi]ATQ18215.1 DedA family protein [Borrelia miyamotoi]
MKIILEFIDLNIAYSPIIFSGLLILAGLNIPISEDAIILIGGMLSSRKNEYTIPIFLGIFFGAYISDIISFCIGRFLAKKLFKQKTQTNKLLDKMNYYYGRYGKLTLLIGRFIPFGFRNAIFISAGMGKMRTSHFLITDFFAAMISITTYFILSFKIGESFQIILPKIKIILLIIFIIITIIIVINYIIKKKKTQKVDKLSK